MRPKYLTIIALLFGLSLSVVNIVRASVASSTNYALERDSLNNAGLLSTSTNYSLEDTVGEVGSGLSSSTSYTLNAGYQQGEYTIAISVEPDITLLPKIVSLEGGQANGSGSWTVTTDNPGGYSLSIRSGGNPALSSGSGSFANYTTVLATPDFPWSVVSSASEFGFSPEGGDIISNYLDNGSTCAVGALDTTLSCWDSILVSDKRISRGTGSNSPGGTDTTIRFRAEAGSSAGQLAGSYSASITLTASAL